MSRHHRLLEAGAVALILAAYAALAVHSLRQKSATFDEPPHLAAGYTYWHLGDYRLNLEHPPLVKRLAALPLLFRDIHIETDTRPWVRSKQWDFGRAFLYQWNDGDPLLYRGRTMVVGLGVLLLASVWACTRRRAGPAAGLFALVLCATNPDVLAHGQLVTTDLGAALFVLVTVAAFGLVVERASAMRIVAAGLALGALLSTKFSGVAVLPILAVIAGAAGLDASRAERAQRSGRLALAIVAMAAVALVIVWAAYGFQHAISPGPDAAEVDWAGVMPSSPVLAAGARAVRALHVLPDAYVYGFLMFRHHAQERPAFLMGELSREGWPHYFLVTFALKTPLPLLLVVVLMALPPWRRPESWTAAALVWVPLAAYAAFALTSRLNIGHRHLLPLYPFLFVAAGPLAAHADRRRRWLSGAIAVASAIIAWRAHPDHLSYFNAIAGGPSQGYRYLVDSNLDWGQDLKRLKSWLDASGIERVKLAYFGTADPAYYGIQCERLPGHPPPKQVARVEPGDVVVVSATHLQGVYLERDERRLMRLLRDRTPIARVGPSLFVYQADFAWSPRP